jgi:hypothetical protein
MKPGRKIITRIFSPPRGKHGPTCNKCGKMMVTHDRIVLCLAGHDLDVTEAKDCPDYKDTSRER